MDRRSFELHYFKKTFIQIYHAHCTLSWHFGNNRFATYNHIRLAFTICHLYRQTITFASTPLYTSPNIICTKQLEPQHIHARLNHSSHRTPNESRHGLILSDSPSCDKAARESHMERVEWDTGQICRISEPNFSDHCQTYQPRHTLQ